MRLTHTQGAGNIVDSPKVGPVGGTSEDVIPEPAMRNAAGYDNFHTGVSFIYTSSTNHFG